MASVTAQSGKRQFFSKMMQQSSQFRPLMHKNPRAKELLINQLNRRFEVHQGKGDDSPGRAVSNSVDSTNLKDIPPFNKRIMET